MSENTDTKEYPEVLRMRDLFLKGERIRVSKECKLHWRFVKRRLERIHGLELHNEKGEVQCVGVWINDHYIKLEYL